MGLFTDIGTMDSLMIIFAMWATYSITGSIVFLALGTPWEIKDEWYYIVAREAVRVVIGFFTSMLLVHIKVTFIRLFGGGLNRFKAIKTLCRHQIIYLV